ncbi:uracil-DNA glycosylase [Rhizobium sp. PP-F2F-G38]|uniref:Uracil-DNA glycosylase family protein n=1 Tax=Ferranicluibacter rubi TaxID=2715133 RepID=A0AA43ZDX4_9HYPH|nr:uracil-DNA glycosylase family protein [Ferranicluibacter rubi]NHT75341.1 uracil-DNA glycosylase family protein [Ferranicluibacter rubi]PYE36860.1 uracil-DNA glycosylase [Rhizobium sp. PP-WC-1G-195]PYF00313.1 uracil-DNA glycosylase [Rhizobium sp. PP-F2F-G38]
MDIPLTPTRDDIDQLSTTISACRICRDAPVFGAPLPHEPRPIFVLSAKARILIASQAPGMRAHVSGVPFDDPSGNRLRDWLGVDRPTFYDPDNFAIVPMGFCFPGYDKHGGDIPPRRECAPVWRETALAAVPNASLILVIGAYAQAYHLGTKRQASMTATVADWRRTFERAEGPKLLPLPHPSWRNTPWLKRNPWFEAELLPVLRAEIALRIS